MPVYTIETPTGAKLDIEAPDEKTAIAGAQQWHQQQQPKTSLKDYAVDALKSIPHGITESFGNMLSASGAAANAEMSQPDNPNPSPEEARQALEQNVTGETHTPTTPAGKITSAAAGALVNPTSYLGPGSLPLKLLSAAGAGAGGSIGQQAAAGTGYELPASLLGGLIGGGIPAALDRPPTQAAIPAPTSDALHNVANAAYQGVRDQTHVALQPQVVQATLQRARAELAGRNLGPETAGATDALMNSVEAPLASGQSFTMKDLDLLRKRINQVQQEAAGGYDTAAAATLRSHVDDLFDNLPQQRNYQPGPQGIPIGQSPMASGSVADAQAAMRTLREADGNKAAALRSDMLSGKIGDAQLKANTENSGMNLENKIRQAAASILLEHNEHLRSGITPAQLTQIRQIAEGTLGANVNRQIGNRLGGGGGFVSSLLAGAGGALGGFPGALIGGLGGTAVRMAGNARTLAAIQRVEESLRMASPLGRNIVQPRQQGIPAATVAATLLRSLANGADVPQQ